MLVKYVGLNIKSLVKNHIGIFLLIMLSEIAAALCILFSYGLVMKMQDDNVDRESGMFFYKYSLNNVTGIADKSKEFIESLHGDVDIIDFDLYVTDKYGKVRTCAGSLGMGVRPHCCVLNDGSMELLENGKVMISGVEFEVAEIKEDGRGFKLHDGGMAYDLGLNLPDVPEAAVATEIRMDIISKPTSEKVDYINQKAKEIFNANVEYSPKPIDLMEEQQNNTFYAYAFVIVMIAVMNLAMYFRYIVGLRKKQIRILTACGATKDKVKNIFLIENLIELIAGYLTAFLMFRLGLFRLLLNYYPGFEDYYSVKVYLMTFAIFAVGSALILMLLISPDIRRAVSAGKEGAT